MIAIVLNIPHWLVNKNFKLKLGYCDVVFSPHYKIVGEGTLCTINGETLFDDSTIYINTRKKNRKNAWWNWWFDSYGADLPIQSEKLIKLNENVRELSRETSEKCGLGKWNKHLKIDYLTSDILQNTIKELNKNLEYDPKNYDIYYKNKLVHKDVQCGSIIIS